MGKATRRERAAPRHGAFDGLADADGLGVVRGTYVPSRVRGEDDPVDLRLAPVEQAAQEPDLARDELGRAQARRVEAEHGRPARRLVVSTKPFSSVTAMASATAALPTSAGLSDASRVAASTSTGSSRDPTREAARAGPAVVDDRAAGRSAGGRRLVAELREERAVGVGQEARVADLPDEDRLALVDGDRQRRRQPDVDPGVGDGRAAARAPPAAGPVDSRNRFSPRAAGERGLDRRRVGELDARRAAIFV